MLKSRYVTFLLVFVLLIVTLVGVTGASAAPKSALSVSLAVEKSTFTASDAVLVNVTISNLGKKAVKVLKWYTPAEEVEEPIFTVTSNGAPVNYAGAHYKRTAPTASDYVTLKAGESMKRVIDLGLYYDLSVSGVYEIEYNAEVTSISSNKVNVSIEGRAAAPLADLAAPLAVSGSTSFTKCTASQQGNLTTARTEASTYATNAFGYLNAGTQGLRYTTWFGALDSGRYTTAKNHFSAISTAMDTASVTFNCGCKKKNVYAYVYPNQPYTIYLCGVFWNAPMTGTDSKAGTLIHEMSHFTIVANTDDWAYGQTAAKNLALTDPNKAVDNADSHEYFAENNPSQP